MKQFPILYKIDSKGKTRVYRIEITSSTSYSTSTGILDGSLITKTYSPVAKGKNTVLEQVEKDAQSKWNKKFKRELYREDISKPHPLSFIQPVLARDYLKVGDQIDWVNKEYVAPRKLNGVRCIAQFKNPSVLLTSKKGKPYKIPHIEKQLLEQVFSTDPSTIVDGEIYIHGVDLGDITHAIAHAEDHPELEYHAFDLVHNTDIFRTRYRKLYNFGLNENLAVVAHCIIRNEEEMIAAHDKYVKEGYEGTMIRDINSVYEHGQRSLGLFKRKSFQDSEFDIVNVIEDSEGGATLVLQTDKGKVFNSRPIGTNEFRKKLLQNKNLVIGKKATAKYSVLLATGIPEFNRTIAIRDYE